MNSLVKAYPNAVRHLADSTLFYFGTPTADVLQLPGASKFEIVYSPRPPHGWELVEYQVFDEKSGVAVLSRRNLEADEIAHFERLMADLKRHTGTSFQYNSASV